jgi:hypothetical protein
MILTGYFFKSLHQRNAEVCSYAGKQDLDRSFFRGKCPIIMIKRYSIIKIFNLKLLKTMEERDSIPIAGDLRRLSPTGLYVE